MLVCGFRKTVTLFNFSVPRFSIAVPWPFWESPPVILKPLNSALPVGVMVKRPGMVEAMVKGGARVEFRTTLFEIINGEDMMKIVIPVSPIEKWIVSPGKAHSILYRSEPYPSSSRLLTTSGQILRSRK
jgi:hypothetical protein